MDMLSLNTLQPQPNLLKNMPAAAANEAEIEKLAQEYESVFIGQLLQYMYTDIDADGLFGGGSAEEMFRPMLLNEYGTLLGGKGGIGLASHIKEELLRLQEVQS